MSNEWDAERRKFLHRSGIAATALLTAGGAFAQARKVEKKQEEVGPTEDLMREHGVLNRVLLIYDHFIAEIDHQQDLKPEWVTGAATVIRRFVEDYHERQEEQFLFPRFEKAGVLTDLVPVLKAQHDAGRQITDQVMSLAKARAAADRTKLAVSLRKFIRMYRPHEAREDTVLFPALRKIVSPHEFDALGDQFENNEHKQFGGDGFEIWRDRVAELEKQLGIYDLAQFTPKV